MDVEAEIYDRIDKSDFNDYFTDMYTFTDVIMSETDSVIDDDDELFKLTTELAGEPEELYTVDNLESEHYGKITYDLLITEIRIIDKDGARYVMIKYIYNDEESVHHFYEKASFYKIVLEEDSSDYDKEYAEMWDGVSSLVE